MTRTFRTLALAAAGLAAAADTAAAGWDNAFQVACLHCRRPRVAAYYAPPAAPSVSKTEVVERCHYEPVTVMKPETVTEPVNTVERRSYYEPVTEYTTRSYYNEATCRTESVAVPRTSFVRREECNTVVKYVERVRMVPVQTQRKVCERTPVTTITQYGPTTRNYECDSCTLPPAGGRGPELEVTPANPPTVAPERIAPVPNVMNGTSAPKPKPSQSRYTGPVNARSVSRKAPVMGEVVQRDQQTPRPNTKVIFLSAANIDDRVEATTDAYGQFDTTLPAGEWFVYLGTGTGRAMFYKTVSVGDAGKQFQMVSR